MINKENKIDLTRDAMTGECLDLTVDDEKEIQHQSFDLNTFSTVNKTASINQLIQGKFLN